MPLININADLRATAKALGRIAHVLERIATEYMGIPLKAPEESKELPAEEVSYTSERQEIRKEIAKNLNIGLEPEDESVQS